jgi:hypothetical protein
VTAEEAATMELDSEIFQISELTCQTELAFQQRHAQAIRDDIESVRRELMIGGIVAIEEVLEIIRRAVRQHPNVPWDQDYSQAVVDSNSMPPSSIYHFKQIFIQNNLLQRRGEYARERPCLLKIVSIHVGGNHLTNIAAFKELLIDQNEIPDIYAIAHEPS